MTASTTERLVQARYAAIWLVFGALLLLIVGVAAHADRTLHALANRNRSARDEFLRRDRLLDTLRFELYQSSIALNTYVFDPIPFHRDRGRESINGFWRGVDSTLVSLNSAVEGEQRQHLTKLTETCANLRQDVDAILLSAPTQPPNTGLFLVRQVLPQYTAIATETEDLAASYSSVMGTGEDTISAAFSSLRWRLSAVTFSAVLLGFVIALLSSRRIKHLEAASWRHYNETVQAHESLEKLSAMLMAAQEEERRKLSRELHDELGQTMSAVVLELSTAEPLLPSRSEEARSRVQLARRLAESAVSAVRDMALLLRPSMLDDLGLVPALRWHAREVSRRTGMNITLLADHVPDDLEDEQRTCIYRVVQEALRNAARHARARAVRIVVRRDASHIRVSIQDDGVGFDSQREKGMGILGMEERVRAAGGALRIDSEPEGGTVIGIRIPATSKGNCPYESRAHRVG
jgi:signal transduction histidine kinase